MDVSLVFFPLASNSDLPTIFQIRKKFTWNMEKEWLTVVETVSSLISTPVFVSSLFFSASSFLFLCLSKVCSIWTAFWIHFINSLSANFTNGQTHSNNLSGNCRRIFWVFDHFMGLALNGLMRLHIHEFCYNVPLKYKAWVICFKDLQFVKIESFNKTFTMNKLGDSRTRCFGAVRDRHQILFLVFNELKWINRRLSDLFRG